MLFKERTVFVITLSTLLIGAAFCTSMLLLCNHDNQKIVSNQKENNVTQIMNFESNQLLSYYNTSSFAGDAVLVDDYVFLATEIGGLFVLDISDPTQPISVEHYIQGANIYRIVVKDDLAYLSCGPDGLQIINISNPLDVVYVSHLNWTYTENPESTAQMEIVGNYLYVCDVHDDFKIINVTDPYNPTLIGSCFFLSSAMGLAVKDNFAYIGAWNNRLVVINISDPTNPQVTFSNYTTISYAIGVQIKDNLVYVADWENGLHIWDITTPETPVYMNNFSMTKLRDITILNDFAFVADSDRGLHVFNLTDPLNPYIINTFSNAGYTSRVIAYNDYVLVANGLSGLLIYNTSDVIIPRPPTSSQGFGVFINTSIILIIFSISILVIRRKRK